MSRSLALGTAIVTALTWCGTFSNFVVAARGDDSAERVQFERDIAPILAERCYACHGPDEHEGQLRLDAREIVFRGGVSGPAVVAGDSQASPLFRRAAGLGDEPRMPPDEEPLTDEQLELIGRWIDQGADWPAGVGSDATTLDRHWAYVPPVRPRLPRVERTDWIRSPVDAFVLAQLEREGLQPSAEAEPARLIRRVYLDLTGLPPTAAEVEDFLNDARPGAYERVVDRLLASANFGPRWARPWLDAARYADSNGYQADQFRSVWPYRDWVVRAFNRDMPFDQFTREQIAGDLLPDATLDQRIATGFHRLTTCNVEAGVDPEENRVNQIIDRVNTTGTVWLGTTMECAQCHNHKYDPFTQRDYYRLFAYFNNTPLEVQGDGVTYEFVGPTMDLPLDDEQVARKAELAAKRNAIRAELKSLTDERMPAFAEWSERQAELLAAASGEAPDQAAVAANAAGDAEAAAAESQEVAPPDDIAKILRTPADKRKPAERKKLETYFLELEPRIKELNRQHADANKQLAAIQPVTTLVMIEQDEPRETAVFKRGNFLDRGEQVTMSTPEALSALNDAAAEETTSEEAAADEATRRDRRELAAWLVDPENPLTARVAVNRWWAEIFGQGIVATVEDFGSQGEPPTHPELLDWLAVELRDGGWSMKRVLRAIVTSSTYRQTSRMTPELLERDPANRLYARGPRLRLPAETIRDNALAIAGLLSTQLEGPPVYPPQPDGIWRHVGRNAPKYATSQGNDRFRRGLYVFWRRSAPYPSFTNFDAPDRASCVVKRPRTNTPLQALTLLNDPAYVEMALAFARRIADPATDRSIDQRIEFAFRSCVARAPTSDEAQVLRGVYERERARLAKTPKEVSELLGTAARNAASNATAAEEARDVAAWFYIANILLNLDETITKG